MKKTSLIWITIIVAFIGAALLVYMFINDDRNPDIELDKAEEKRLTSLEKLLKESDRFKDSDISSNKDKNIVTIDGKYDITIKSGYYMMSIKDPKEEDTYCEIVDAVEQSLGKKKEASIETCKETLKGSISIGGIAADIFDNHKILTVNSDEPAKLYDIDSSHKEKDIISVDEINYNIKIDDNLFTSMSNEYVDENKNHTICGHIYNPVKINEKFTFKIYDKDKNELDNKNFTYEGTTKKYSTFCMEFERDLDDIKYYSIEVK